MCSSDLADPAVLGHPGGQGTAVADVAQWLDHRATFLGRWGLKPVKDGPDYEELVATEGMPRLRMWLDRITTEQLANFSVVYGGASPYPQQARRQTARPQGPRKAFP